MTLRIKVRRLKRLMARNKREAEDMLVIIKGGLPGIELTHEEIERACAEVRAINAAGKGTGRVHVIGGLPPRPESHAVGAPKLGGDHMTFNQEVMGSNPSALTR